MKNFKYLKVPSYQTFLLPSGQMVNVYDVLYSSKADLERGTYLPSTDDNYKKSPLPTFSDLVRLGLVSVISCVDSFEITFGEDVRTLTAKDLQHVKDQFKSKGFDISLRALRHNYYAWLSDFKSGYRGRGYHLFTPCGCNPLSFRVTTLHKSCRSWQDTYIA